MSLEARDLTMVTWSEFARNAHTYQQRIQSGESFMVTYRGEPMAAVLPITREDIQINASIK